LADYLFFTDLPVPASQRKLVALYRNAGLNYAVLDLSDLLGYSLWETDAIQEMAAKGRPFSERHVIERQAWEGFSTDEREDWEEDFFTSEQDYIRLGQEFQEAQNVPPHICHADIPYRPILAALFKGEPDANKRYKHLDYFYQNLHECASK